jgi:cell division protein FtsB
MKIRRLVPFVVLIGLVGVLFVAVFPTRTWLAQKNEREAAVAQLELLEEQNAILASRVDALQSDEEIERLAREQYNLVRPGEEAYALLPAPSSATGTTVPIPVEADEDDKRSVPSKVWDFLTGWL